MRPLNRLHSIATILCIGLMVLAMRAAAQADAPPSHAATSPAKLVDFEVHEWVILVCDPYQPQASGAKLVETTTLPSIVETRRQRAPTTQQSDPCPVGVIRIIRTGEGASDARIDVKLDVNGGRIMSSWPKGQARSSSMLWPDLVLSAKPGRLHPLPQENWLASLRDSTSSSYVTAEERSERFLLYDVEVNYALPLKLGGGRQPDDPVQLANVGTVALHDVVLYRRHGEVWRTAVLAQLPGGSKPAPPAATQPAATTVPTGDDLFEPLAPTTAPASAPPTTQPSTQPTTQPTTQPSDDASMHPLGVDPADVVEVRLLPGPTTAPSEILNDWRERLSRVGLVSDDFDLILRILKIHALDPKRLTAVYRLDEAELERLLPLEVIPQPRRTVRVGLVIATTIDPAVPAEIDALIAQLGDRDWRKREQASESLAALGVAAKTQLQAAVKHEDAEIALRAERLLASMEK